MELINEAVILVDSEAVDKAPTQGLMCLDACKCMGDCDLVTRHCSP